MDDPGRKQVAPLWTEEEVAAYLRVEVSTVRTWVKRRGLPHVKAGRLNRFRKDEIDRWTEGHAGKAEGADAGAGDVARAA